ELTAALRASLDAPATEADAKKKELEAKLGKATSLALASAVIDALAAKPFAPKTLDALDALVTASKRPRDVEELRLLNRLGPPAQVALGGLARGDGQARLGRRGQGGGGRRPARAPALGARAARPGRRLAPRGRGPEPAADGRLRPGRSDRRGLVAGRVGVRV